MNNTRYGKVKKILWIILAANLAVAAVKICVGKLSGSGSVVADGVHSLADSASNIVGLIGIYLASKPRDEKHQYGHGKYEVVASLFIGVMLAVMSARIIYGAVLSFFAERKITADIVEISLMIFTIAVNSVVAFSEFRVGKRLNSTILVTDSLHTRSDIFISLAVVLGLVCINAGLPVWIDGVMSALVALAVLVSAWQIIKNCVDVLVDSSAVDAGEVRKLLMTIPGIYDICQIRSRGEPAHAFIDLHAVVSPCESVTRVHEISHLLEDTLKTHFGEDTEVSIHIEPGGDETR